MPGHKVEVGALFLISIHYMSVRFSIFILHPPKRVQESVEVPGTGSSMYGLVLVYRRWEIAQQSTPSVKLAWPGGEQNGSATCILI